MLLPFVLPDIFVRQEREYNWGIWKKFLQKKPDPDCALYCPGGCLYAFQASRPDQEQYGSCIVLGEMEPLSSRWFLPVLFLARTYVELLMNLSWKARTAMVMSAVIFYVIGMAIPHNNTGGMPWSFDMPLWLRLSC